MVIEDPDCFPDEDIEETRALLEDRREAFRLALQHASDVFGSPQVNNQVIANDYHPSKLENARDHKSFKVVYRNIKSVRHQWKTRLLHWYEELEELSSTENHDNELNRLRWCWHMLA